MSFFFIARVSSGCGITHITVALWQSAFAAVRITELQRRWILHALVEFWLAVILRAHRALSQALYEALEGSERLLNDIKKVLNLNRVCAAESIYNPMRVVQGKVAEAAELRPEAISPAETPLLYGAEALEVIGSRAWWQEDPQIILEGDRVR
jgi:hypothetical protein